MLSKNINRLFFLSNFQNTRFLFSTKPDYYKLFGLTENFTQEQLRSSYLQLVKLHHPDLSKQADSAEKFRQIQEGYAILSDPVKRSALKAQAPKTFKQQQTFSQATESFRKVFYEDYKKKDELNDEFNFSYKLFKQHHTKVQQPKASYKKYEGTGGQAYYAKKDQNAPDKKKQIAATVGAVGVLALAYFYTRP